MLKTDKNESIIVSVLHARANFDKLLQRVEDDRRSRVHCAYGTLSSVIE